MSDLDQPVSGQRPDPPGKTRTWWHPLLARLLDHALATAYQVSEEVPVGKLPLRLDILLIRRQQGELTAAGRSDLTVLLPLLNRFTLIQFKGPTDTLERGDLAQLVGCAYLWHSQQIEPIAQRDMSLILLAPALNNPLRAELRLLECQSTAHEEGVFRISGLPLATWLIETDVMAELGQPILSLVSRVFLTSRERIIEQLTRTGHAALLYYMLQQVQQFRSLGEDFAMQHKDSEYLGQVEEELLTTVLEAVPVEKRFRGLSPEDEEKLLTMIPPEKRFRGLSPEDQEKLLTMIPAEKRLRGLSPEEVAAGLSEEQAAKLRELLDRRQDHP